MVLFLLVVLVAVALGIVGVVAKGLLYLLIIGIVILAADLVFGGFRLRGRRNRPAR
ncbi:MAG: hypothetical protein M3Z75_02255 [Actinomycetota bacterium]|jgi:hypothetical protein|nr:hypothetical protein [Actinomycetota bacterium]